jgi:hypothetical protein
MSPKDYFAFLLDHTTIVAIDDPYLKTFQQMDADGIIQLRILPATGCEKFAEHFYYVINAFLKEETEGELKQQKLKYMNTKETQQVMENNETYVSLFEYLGKGSGGTNTLVEKLRQKLLNEALILNGECYQKKYKTRIYSSTTISDIILRFIFW